MGFTVNKESGAGLFAARSFFSERFKYRFQNGFRNRIWACRHKINSGFRGLIFDTDNTLIPMEQIRHREQMPGGKKDKVI